MKKNKKIITYGTYDMLHEGHINFLKYRKKSGEYLIAGLSSEDYDRSQNKLNVVQKLENESKTIIFPNGANLKSKLFMVSHMEDITQNDTDHLAKIFQMYLAKLGSVNGS